MINITIPGYQNLQLEHLVLDYNGTIAIDGVLIPGAADALRSMASDITIHVITADTFGDAANQLADLPITLTLLPADNQAQAKRDLVNRLGAKSVIAIGNGRNDRDMLKLAAIGIALLQKEGAAAQTMASADIVCGHILDALELLRHPKRLIATLRS